MDLAKIAEELGVPVESLTKQNKSLLDKYLSKKPVSTAKKTPKVPKPE